MNSCSHLALQELETGTTPRADVAQLVLRVMLGNNSGRITTADNDDRAIPRSLDVGIKKRCRSICKGREFEYAGRST
jgi:hypothetical protein